MFMCSVMKPSFSCAQTIRPAAAAGAQVSIGERGAVFHQRHLAGSGNETVASPRQTAASTHKLAQTYMSPHGRTRTDATLSRRRRRMHTMASQRTTTAHPSAPHALSGSLRTIGRRQVLGASGAGAVALALAACTGGGQSAREASEQR